MLQLLAASNHEIAQARTLAPATVKKHISNLLGKLDAHSRSHAVARARDLGLI